MLCKTSCVRLNVPILIMFFGSSIAANAQNDDPGYGARTQRPVLELDRELKSSFALIAVGNVIHFAGTGLWAAGYAEEVREFLTASTIRERAINVTPLRLAGGALMAAGPLLSSIGSATAQCSAVRLTKDPYTRPHFLDYGKGALFVALGSAFGMAGGAMAANSGEESVLMISTISSLILSGMGEYFWLRSATEPATYVKTMKNRMVKGDLQFSLTPLIPVGGGGLALTCTF